MGAPQIIWIVLAAMAVTIDIMKDGEPKEGRHSAIRSIVAVTLIAGLLWWGGFF